MSALRKKVLVVDDDPVVARSFDRVLSDKGYAVITASDGPEALKKLADAEYDVVFTDIRMPGMDGIEVAERAKARRPWVPVVIITGYGTQENQARADAAGVAQFLHKPLSPEMIEASASKALAEAKTPPALAPQAEWSAPAAAAEQAAAKPPASLLKTLGMLIAAPFIGLAYAIAFPFIGLGVLAWMGGAELLKRSGKIGRFAKNLVLFIAAPIVGLAYVVAFPFVGLAVLAWMGAKAVVKR
jgi:CheY-like chemotaxis protein